MKVRMRNRNVLIERLDSVEKTKGGLFLAISAVEKPQVAVVLFAPAARESEVRPGDYVIFPKYWDRTLELNGKELLLIPESELHAVITLGP